MITYTHRVHPRARSIKIRIEANGEVVVVTPKRYSAHQLEQFISQNQAWITVTQQKALAKRSLVQSDDKVLIFGQPYQLVVQFSKQEKLGVRLEDHKLIVNPIDPTATEPSSPEVKKQLDRFLKHTAEKYIIPRTHQLAEVMNISFQSISLRQQKTRWGSCSSTGSLNFNWRLVHYAPAVIDYVIIHELAHRKHMDHSKAFWNLVKKYDSEYLLHRGWLKRHGMSVG